MYVHRVKRVGALLRRYGFDVLIAIAAIEIVLEVALRYGAANGPTTPRWFAVLASALMVVPLLARRRFPFAAPAAVWVLAAALSLSTGGWSGDAVPLPRAIDLSAYRIVQEGLTNSLKHAKASRADVTVRYGAEDFELEVRDDGIGAPSSDGLGHGLVGIQERVKIYGGEMSAGPGQGGGFVLTARLPLEGRRP